MEGFNSRTLKAYDYLAYYYDALLSNEEDLLLWLKEIEKEDFHSVLELASGSGLMAKLLKNRGYDVVASDMSFSMKEAAKKNFDGEYLLLDMRDFNLDRKFDLILCICDSINYLEFEDLSMFFKNVYLHLNSNGRLIFDMHHFERINEFKDEYVEEGKVKDINYQWTIISDSYSNTINEHFTFYTDDGMIQEQHIQHVFRPNEVIKLLEDAGFKVEYIEDFVKNEKVLMVCKK